MQINHLIKVKNWHKSAISISGVSNLKIKGVAKLPNNSIAYPCQIFLFESLNMQMLQRTLTRRDGSYVFEGLVSNCEYTIVATDYKKEFNSVIQSNVVPK